MNDAVLTAQLKTAVAAVCVLLVAHTRTSAAATR